VSLLVKGQSGIGKTELLERFERDLRHTRRDVVVLRGRCFAREAVPYKSFDAIMDGLSGHLAKLPVDDQRRLVPRHDELLARAFPVLKRVELFTDPRVEREQVRDPQEQRGRVFTAVRTLFSRFAASTPAGGGAGRPAVARRRQPQPDRRAAARARPAAPAVLGHAAHRGRRAPRRRARAAGRAALRVLHALAPLSDDEALALAHSLLGGDDLAAPRALAIVRESHGHPLFIDELARHALSTATTEVGALDLEQAIRARIRTLGADVAVLLEALAVAAGPVTLDILARATQLGTERVVRAATQCRIQRLVRMSGVRRSDTVELYHGRIAGALAETLSEDQMRSAHERLARALEVERDADAMSLATHWAGAGEKGKAARYAVKAAQEANESLAFDRAASLFRLSLTLEPGEAEGLEGRRQKLAHALANAGRGEEAGECFLAAVEGASEAVSIDLRRRAAEQFLLSGHVRRGIASFKPILRALGLPYPESLLRSVWSTIVVRTLLFFRRERFVLRDESMVAPHERLRVDTAHSMAVGLAVTDTMRGFDYYGRALLLALKLGEPGRVAIELAMEASSLVAMSGRKKRKAHRMLELARGLAERSGNANARAAVHYSEGMSAYLMGEWQRGQQGLERAEQLYRNECAQAPAELRTLQASIVHCLWEQGRLARAAGPHGARAEGVRGARRPLHRGHHPRRHQHAGAVHAGPRRGRLRGGATGGGPLDARQLRRAALHVLGARRLHALVHGRSHRRPRGIPCVSCRARGARCSSACSSCARVRGRCTRCSRCARPPRCRAPPRPRC
jgi:hypothetical protein